MDPWQYSANMGSGQNAGRSTPSFVNLSGTVETSGLENNAESGFAESILGAGKQLLDSGLETARSVIGGTSEAGSMADSLGNTFFTPYRQKVNFAMSMGVGLIFMLLSLLVLPTLVFAPQKFALLFTLGSLCWVNGLGMLKGYRALLTHLSRPQRVPYSVAYGVSLLLTFYATLVAHSYFLTLIFCLIQIGSLLAVLVSYFPGGPALLTYLMSVGVDKIKALFNKNGESQGGILGK